MTPTAPKDTWVARMAALEDNGCVSVGGLAASVVARARNERLPELMALGKLVELRRREKGFSVEELVRRANVSEAALLDLESGLRLPNTRDVIGLLAQALDLPQEKLIAAAGLGDTHVPDLSSAALRFAARARPTEKLSPTEQTALGEFLKFPSVA